jgi:acetyl esterase/lipase
LSKRLRILIQYIVKRFETVTIKIIDSTAKDDYFLCPQMTTLQKPHSTWWHPEKTWTDILIGWVVTLLLPLKSVKEFSPSKDSVLGIQCIQGLRDRFRKLSASSFQSKKSGALFLWGKAAECDIVDYSYTIPRRPNILREWDICREGDTTAEFPTCKDDIRVNLFFPVSLIQHVAPSMVDVPKETNDFGCIPMSTKDGHHLDLTQIPESVPIVIYFHGGGLTMGSSYDHAGVGFIRKISEMMPNDKPIILASVDYSLAPELPFPTAVMEALTAVGHFCELLENHKIHLAGISAGGNLAAVASMEAFRKYPGRIRTSLISCPMLDPACDSLSYHLNSTSSHICPIEFLHWCWQAYLELPVAHKDGSETTETPDNDTADTADDMLSLGSNRKAWNESKWKNTSLERLVNPLANISSKGWKGATAPKILVQTNRGDPLRDDGFDLANKLRSVGADVTHIDAGGSHYVGLTMELALQQSMLETWKDAILLSS